MLDPSPVMRSLLARSLLVALGLVIGAAFVEGGLRLLGPAPTHGLRGLHRAEPNEPWLYRGRPGAEARVGDTGEVLYRINAEGFRDASRRLERKDGAYRVGVVGDSIAFGYGVNVTERFTERLEAELAHESGRGVEVLNFGVAGFNAYNEAALVEGLVSEYELDLLLVQFCVNDLNDPTLHFDAQTRVALGELPDAAFPNPDTRGQVGPRSGPERALDRCRLRLCSLLRRAFPADEARQLEPRELALAMAPRSDLGDGPERSWLEGHYANMAAVAAAGGARFGVLVFPYSAQLEALEEKARGLGLQRDLATLAKQRGWLLIDLFASFRDAGPGEALFVDMWHPTARGHAIAAEAVAAGLRRHGVPERSADAATGRN